MVDGDEKTPEDEGQSARDEAQENLLHLAYFERRLNHFVAKCRELESDPYLRQNAAISHEIKTLCDAYRAVIPALRSKVDQGSMESASRNAGKDLREILDNLNNYGMWLRLDSYFSAATRERVLNLRDLAESICTELVEPSRIEERKLDELLLELDESAPALPADGDEKELPPERQPTRRSRRPGSALPQTVKSKRTPISPTAQGPVETARPDDQETGEETLNLRRLGSTSHNLELSERGVRSREVLLPPMPIVESSRRKQLRNAVHWLKLIVLGVLILALLTGIFLGVRMAWQHFGGGGPAGVMPLEAEALARNGLGAIDKALPEAMAAETDLSRRRVLLAAALTRRLHDPAAELTPDQRNDLKARIVSIFVELEPMPTTPETSCIIGDFCRQEAKRGAHQQLQALPPFPEEEVLAAARQKYPFYRIGEQIEVLYQLNPQRILSCKGEFKGREGDDILVGDKRIPIQSVASESSLELMRFDQQRSETMQRKYVEQQKAEYEKRIAAKGEEVYARQLRAQLDVAKRVNEASGYIYRDKAWYSLPQLVDALLLAGVDAH